MARLVLANQATSAKRRVYFDCRDVTDGITPETGEAGGQPQVSSDGASWTNTGIGTLTAIGNGRYYADLTQTLVATAGTVIETRYKSANTAETPGDSVQVVAFDPDDQNALGLGSLDGHTPQSGDCFARLGAPAGASVSADVAAVKGDTAAILLDTAELQADWANGGRLDLLIDAILADTNELQVDWTNGGRLDLLLDTAAAGGAGLTAQQVRDAMKLAPTAGTPTAGSVDAHLDAIEAKTNLITTARTTVRVVSPVGLDGTTLDLVRADDYTADLVDRPVVIDVGDVEFVAADVATVTLTVRDSQSGTVLFSASGAAVDATDDDDNAVIRTTTPITRTQSATVRHGANTGLFDLKLALTDGTVYSAIADGEVNAAGA